MSHPPLPPPPPLTPAQQSLLKRGVNISPLSVFRSPVAIEDKVRGGQSNESTFGGMMPVISMLVGVSITGAALYVLHRRALRNYGSNEAILRLIWEGDHLMPEERKAVDLLEACAGYQFELSKILNNLHERMDFATLNQIDGGNSSSSGIKSPYDWKIPRDLGALSNDLDKLAGKLDSVVTSDEGIKAKRKEQVLVMNHCMRCVDKALKVCNDAHDFEYASREANKNKK